MFNFAAFATHFLCVMAGGIAGVMIMALMIIGKDEKFDSSDLDYDEYKSMHDE